MNEVLSLEAEIVKSVVRLFPLYQETLMLHNSASLPKSRVIEDLGSWFAHLVVMLLSMTFCGGKSAWFPEALTVVITNGVHERV